MTWQILIPLLFIAWAGFWYHQSRSAVIVINLLARNLLLVGAVVLITRWGWQQLRPAGVCPITTPPLTLAGLFIIPIVSFVVLSFLSSYFPQVIPSEQGVALLSSEDHFFRYPFRMKQLSGREYEITSAGKPQRIRLRGWRADALIEQLQACSQKDSA